MNIGEIVKRTYVPYYYEIKDICPDNFYLKRIAYALEDNTIIKHQYPSWSLLIVSRINAPRHLEFRSCTKFELHKVKLLLNRNLIYD